MPIDVTVTAHGAAALDALAAAVRRGQGRRSAGTRHDRRPQQHRRRHGPPGPRSPWRRGGRRGPHPVPRRRAARLAAPARRWSASGVDAHRRPRRQAGPGRRSRPLRVRAQPPVDRGRAARRVSGAAHRRPRGRRRPGPHAARCANRRASPPPSRRRLAGDWYDEGDLLAGAAVEVRAGLPRRFARVIVYLPELVRPLEQALLAAFGAVGAVELLVATCGDEQDDVDRSDGRAGRAADRSTARRRAGGARRRGTEGRGHLDHRCRRRGPPRRPGARRRRPPGRPVRPHGRACGRPTDPTPDMVEHQLVAAGIPWNGRPGTQTAELMVPRVLADLLELDRRGLRRSNLMTLLGDVPARDVRGRPVPTARWERIGRRAGIVREADWERGLHLARVDAGGAPTRRRSGRRVVGGAGDRAAHRPRRPGRAPAAGRRGSQWCHARLDRWFSPAALDRLDGDERAAWELTQRVLDRLGHLDSIGAPVTRAEFRATFVAELEVTPARHGTVGDGVHIGSISGAIGLDLDLVVVRRRGRRAAPPTAARRSAPRRGRSRCRRPAGQRDTRRARPPALRRPHRHDARRPGHRAPRRSARRRRQPSVALARGACPPSCAPWTPTPTHWRRRSSRSPPPSTGPVTSGPPLGRVRTSAGIRLATGDPVLARALALRDGRASARLTEFDGDLSSFPPPPLTGPVSPTQIEQWRACPHAYFVRYLLGVRPIDEPEAIEILTPLDRGNAMHAAIDRLHQRVLADELPDPAPRGWTDVHRAALVDLAEEVAAELQAAGRVRAGRRRGPTSGHAMVDELDEWLVEDAGEWAGRSIRVLRSVASVATARSRSRSALTDGRTIRFVGRIDRIDQLPDGSLIVTDHKTGKADQYRAVGPDDPTLGGTRFQLPVYAAAAQALTSQPDALVRAEYAFLRRGQFQRIGVDVRRRGRGMRCAASWPRSSTASRPGSSRPSRRRRNGGVRGLLVLRARRARHRRSVVASGSASATTTGWPRWFADARGRSAGAPMSGQLSLDLDAPPPAATRRRTPPRERASGTRPRLDLVRRGRRRRRQDDRARRADPHAGRGWRGHQGHRRDHVHREGRGRAAPPPARRAGSPRPIRAGRSTASTMRRSARCTPSPGGCSSSSRSRPACRPGSSCSTSSRAVWPSTSAGRTCSTSCSTIPSRRRRGSTAAELVQLCEFEQFGGTARPAPVAEDFQANWDLVDDRVELDPPPRPDWCRHEALPARWRQSSARRRPEDDTPDRRSSPSSPRSPTSSARRPAPGHHARGASSRSKHAVRQARGAAGTRPSGDSSAARPPSTTCARRGRARRRAVDQLLRRWRHYRQQLLGAIVGRFVLDGARRSGRRRHARVPRPARARPAPARAPTPTSAALLHAALPADPARRVPGHRPDPARDRRAPHRARRPIRRTRPTGDSSVPAPGRLFIVGDPKQSIYRFRRADIAQYLARRRPGRCRAPRC